MIESSSQQTEPPKWVAPAVCMLVVASVWFVFGQTRGFDFVNYDDHEYVYENPMITNGVSGEAIQWAFTRVHAGNWHPLTTISHMLDCQVFGLNAGLHHLTNVVLHAVTALLLFVMCRQLTMGIWAAGFVALLFAIHPLRVESVAWVSERKDVLSGLFFMLTLIAYVRFIRSRGDGAAAVRLEPWRSGTYWLAVMFFALGLMSKPMLVTLPFVLLLLDCWPLARFGIDPLSTLMRRLYPLLVEKTPFFLLTFASCVATVLAQGSAIVPTGNLSVDARAANALVATATYFWQMVWPINLAVLYPYPESSVLLKKSVVALVFLVVVVWVAWKWRKKNPGLLTGWLWYLGMLVPVVGLMQVGMQPHADRYTYLPQIGLYIAFTLLMGEAGMHRGRWRALWAVASVLVLTLLAVRAREQTKHWRDSESLWAGTIANTPPNPMAHAHWGASLMRAGRVGDAVGQYQAALKIAPNHLTALNGLGIALLRQGDTNGATACFERVLQLDPLNARARLQRGLLASNPEGDMQTALAELRAAVSAEPGNPVLRVAYAQVLIRGGRFDEAIVQANEAVHLLPASVEARYQLAVALAARGLIREAIAEYREIIRRQPEHAEAHRNVGNLLLLGGQVAEAIGHYRESLRLKPEQARTRFNLGSAYAMQQRFTDAIEQFEASLRFEPDDAAAHKNLGLALARLGRRDEAIAQFREALRLKPDFPEAQQALQESSPP